MFSKKSLLPRTVVRHSIDARSAGILFLLLVSTAIGGFAQITRETNPEAVGEAVGPGTLFQVSTLDALLQGVYNGSVTVGQLKHYGDFGLGTYEGLDGELVAVNGHFYHMRANGVLTEATDEEVVPFAAVTRFRPDVQFTVGQTSLPDLSILLDTVLPSKNYFYAIKIHGTFATMTTRAIPIQFFPYPPLSQLIPIQSTFAYPNIVGTAVDIRSPAFAAGINQVAHHYHFVFR